MGEWLRRLQYLIHRERFDEELANEMAAHREMAVQSGGSAFGNSLRLREESRDAWGWTWIDRIVQDLRYASRQLRHSPGFTLAAIVILSIGIGVNVAAFGFLNLVVLRPLPVKDPGTLLRFKRRAPTSFAYQMPYPEMAFFRSYSKTLSAVIGITGGKLATETEAVPRAGQFVTANFFSELGAVPAAGRLLDPGTDGASDSAPVVVLSNGYWKSHFAESRDIVGKTIRLNNRAAIVIGVTSPDFSGLSLDDPDFWMPINQEPYFVVGSNLLTNYSFDTKGVTMFGRLQPGVKPAEAEGELRSLAAVLHKAHQADIWENENLPSSPGAIAKNVGGGRSGSGTDKGDEAAPLIALGAALGLLILLAACGNLGSLLLARGIAREREMSIRKAVGAGWVRLVRQLFTESLLLALLGSVAGLVLGYFALRLLLVISRAPAWLKATPDWRVIVFAVAAGLLAAILFGFTPALQIARERHRKTRMRQILIGAQVAASCVLIIVAALLLRALDHALSANPGFEFQQVLSIDPGLGAHGYSPAQARDYFNRLQSRLQNLPGVESVALTSMSPLGNKKVITGAEINARNVDVYMYGIDPQFLATMKIPLLRGRNLTRSDARGLVISKSLSAQWPNRDALGRPFQMGDGSFTVIGVAGNARLVALQDPDAVEAYYLASEAELPSMILLLRTAGPPDGIVPFVSSIARSIDPKIFPVVEMVKSSFRRKMQGAEYAAAFMAMVGLVALTLASLGIVGLVSYSVSQRTKEIGIRLALGASKKHVLSVVARQLASPVSIGLIAGLFGAAALSGALRRELYGISNLDPIAYFGATLAFGIVAVLAAMLPARRALKVNPLTSLRHE